MKRDSTEKFSRNMDAALAHDHPADAAGRSESERGDLEILRTLTAADFSPESRIHRSLKRRLLEPSGTGTAGAQRDRIRKSRVVPYRLALAAALIAVLALAASPLGTSLSRSLVGILESRQVGENTTAVSVDGDFQAVPGENGETILLPAPDTGAIPGSGLPETVDEANQERHLTLDPTIPFDEAQEMVRFDLRMPAYVPEGYRFLGVVVIRTGQASLEFVNFDENRLIALLQTAVGGANGKIQITYTSDIVAVDTNVAGHPALWTQAGDEGLLTWEADGVNYQLVGVSDLETALRTAESLP